MKTRLAKLAKASAAPYEHKVTVSKKLIDGLQGPIAILFSGGRDSSVVAMLAAHRTPTLVYCKTGLQTTTALARTEAVAKKLGLELVALEPEIPAFEMWQQKGHYPIGPKRGHTYLKAATGCKTSPVQCCYWLKERPARAWVLEHKPGAILWGNRAADSNRRKLGIAEHGLVHAPSARWPCVSAEPIAFWTDADVARHLGPGWDNRRQEDGCAVCCTDLARPDNQLSRTFLANRPLFDAAIRAGLGAQILTARGESGLDAEAVLADNPRRFLRIPRVGKD